MIRIDHLSVWDLILTTRSPLHIGTGTICAKTDYLFEPRTETVSMIDREALFAWLFKKRLADRYERFVLSGDTHLYRFLKDNGITNPELADLCFYKIHAADALDDRHSLKEIHPFLRDPQRLAFVPGSSVKGALRTAILAGMMEKEKKGDWPNDPGKMSALEGLYLNRLALKRDRNGAGLNDPVNSLLRGLSISDSEPIPDADLLLVGKIDVNEKGEARTLPLVRECVRPGTELRFRLTIDHSVLPTEFSPETLKATVREFDSFYQRIFLSRFTPPPNAAPVSYQDALILGGGAGFFAKTLAYPYLGTLKGMRYTESCMRRQFSRHGHENDIAKHGISPHTMKYGKYKGRLYPFGVCEVKLI